MRGVSWMKILHVLCIGLLLIVPLGCASRHDEDMEETEEQEEHAEQAGATVVGANSDARSEERGEHHEWNGPETQTTFDDVVVGSLPADWRIEGTNQQDALATWKVVDDDTAPSAPRALALTAQTRVVVPCAPNA